MGIGRVIRKINKDGANKDIMLSVFYPAEEDTEGDYIQLFQPSASEALVHWLKWELILAI